MTSVASRAIAPCVESPTQTRSFLFRTIAYQPSVTLTAPYPENTTFPLALSPSKDSSVNELVQAVEQLARTNTLRSLLTLHGAIYFSNLRLNTAEDFSRFASAFGWAPHEDIGNPVRRTVHAYNVATANEGPCTQPVYPHNEFGLSPHYPAYVLFFCVSEPENGGETPINNSITLYKELQKRYPEFLSELEKKGVKYQLFYPNKPRADITSPGTSILQSYGKHVVDNDTVEGARVKIENEIRRLPTATWQWENQTAENELGDLRVFQVLPATRFHEQSGHIAFFNNVISRFLNAIDAGSIEPPHLNDKGQLQPPAFYGDGSPIPKEYLEFAVNQIRETRSLVRWTRGDVLLLDNHAVQHARQPWTGPRKLLASLWDEKSSR